MAADPADADDVFLTAAGGLASGVIAELGAPLREIRDTLAVLVETLDLHFAEARGPEPYPWAATKALRERLAEIYLVSREVTRTTGDLARAVSVHRGTAEPIDVNGAVEQALALARHRFPGDCELSIDAGEVPAVRMPLGDLVLLVAALLGVAADGARAAPAGASVSVRTRRERPDGAGDQVVVLVQTAGAGAAGDAARAALAPLARRVLGPVGGELVVFAPPEGPVTEIRIPVPR